VNLIGKNKIEYQAFATLERPKIRHWANKFLESSPENREHQDLIIWDTFLQI